MTGASMIEPFFPRRNASLVDAKWREKNLIAAEILGQEPRRQMRPEAVGDRTRLDVMWNGQELGIRDKGDAFVAVLEPESASPAILRLMREWRADPPPVDLIQVRFRSHESSEARGVWLDLSNESIKTLLDQGDWVRRRLKDGWIVEAGQKHKEFVVLEDGSLDFVPARPRPWLDSYDQNNDPLPLESLASLFSQPGPEVNRALLAAGFELLIDADIGPGTSWAEWGAGVGNLSAAYASLLGAKGGWASEIEPNAASLLKKNAETFFPAVEVAAVPALLKHLPGPKDLWIIDPPRPGFPDLLKQLVAEPAGAPRWMLCYHCHAKGLIGDTSLLRSMGYILSGWSSVDAFPGTTHHEVISLWERSHK
jgi:hypothetical protein